MAQVIGVRFREVGKVYYFDPLDNKFEKGDHVIVETVRGMECGEVALENSEVSDGEIAAGIAATRSENSRGKPQKRAGSF